MATAQHAGTGQDGKAYTEKKTFSRETSIYTDIQADPSIIWALLTNAADFPRWNSTIISMEGNIALGEKIVLRSALDPKRTFKLKVRTLEPERLLVWGDGMGKRSYTITAMANGKARVEMREKIGGPLFPLFASYIPPFDEAFERYMADLKKEAEAIASLK